MSDDTANFPLQTALKNLSPEDIQAIEKISELARQLTGVQLTERHRTMVASRIQKRLLELGLQHPSEYLAYFQAHRAEETPRLVSLLTTHYTYFFREFAHFDFLRTQALPQLVPELQKRADKTLRVWSAAVSRGQEAYSLAMFLDLHLKHFDPSLRFSIVGTDVDPESVAIAKNGVYPRDELKEVPVTLLGNHWTRGTGEIADFVKAKKSLRESCEFQVQNLFDLSAFKPGQSFDLIFCRNVFIYFNQDQIRTITQHLIQRMQPRGFLFIGISESLSGTQLAVSSAGPSVYQHPKIEPPKTAVAPLTRAPSPTPQPAPAAAVPRGPIRVLCVDDSPSILTLLKQVLTQEHGFEIVGTAKNGIEAAERRRALHPDVMTLDIHMPEQTGLEYLEKNFGPAHPPVVMVSSVSRDNADLAGKALNLGAADYVEKPALNQLAERAEEIRNKIQCALVNPRPAAMVTVDKQFQHRDTLTRAHEQLRVIFFTLSSRAKVRAMLQEMLPSDPPCVLMVSGAGEALPHIAELLSKDAKRPIHSEATLPAQLAPGTVTLLDASKHLTEIWNQHGQRREVSAFVFGQLSPKISSELLKWSHLHLILEDLGNGQGTRELHDVAADILPYTSYVYVSHATFAKKKAA